MASWVELFDQKPLITPSARPRTIELRIALAMMKYHEENDIATSTTNTIQPRKSKLVSRSWKPICCIAIALALPPRAGAALDGAGVCWNINATLGSQA